MIKAVFGRDDKDRFVSVRISGHSGYDESGKDIVCAAVSSAAMLSANLLTEQFGSDAKVSSRDNVFVIELPAPDLIETYVLDGLYTHLEQIAAQYGGYIEISRTEQ